MNHDTPVRTERRSAWRARAERARYLRERFGPWWWWMWPNMRLSGLPLLGRTFTRLAELPLGAYRERWPLAHITARPYVSPRAQVSCPDLDLHSNCFIDDYVTLYRERQTEGRIVLARGVHVHRGTIIEVGRGGEVLIGEDTHVQANCNLNGYMNSVRIGQDVMIAPQCGFFPYQHRTDDLSRPMSRQAIVSKGDIVVENDVWLGTGVKVMDGVRIGHGAVVGAGAVVTGDLPPYAIAAGVPARVIGSRLDASAVET